MICPPPMKTSRAFLAAALLSLPACAWAAGPKGTKPAPGKVPHSLTVKDLALREAKTCDANRNGKIDASEMNTLRLTQSRNPKSYLYLFDANENKYLDDSEIAKIKFTPAKAQVEHELHGKKK